MMRSAEVRLLWLVGGLSNHSPRGQRICLPARFDHQSMQDWLDDAWSLVVEVEGIPDALGNQIGNARFLVPNAPHDWLSVGKKFTLFEGNLAVATGEIQKVTSPNE
jgi:hypothetical protein